METVDPEETDAMRLHFQRQHICGFERFRRAIEEQLGRIASRSSGVTPLFA